MKSLLDLLYPPKCLLCGKILENAEYLCMECRKTAPFYPNRKTKLQFLDSVTAVWYYKENVRDSLLRFKFGHCPHLASGYGHLLGLALKHRYPEGFDLVTYVPTASRRRFRRGYDQAQLLSKAVGREISRKPDRLLKKIRNNPAQSGIHDASARKANVLGAYRLTGRQDIAGKRILLIDDILTTGATAGECARMLRTAGAAEVHLAVVAVAAKN